MAKKRLDLILFERGFFDTKSAASASILAHNVKINDIVVSKAGEMFDENVLFDENNPAKIEINQIPYVSRGGLKLEAAIKAIKNEIKEKNSIDKGDTTGDFSDCMLQEGAKFVYALDCGYNQLAWKLRDNPKIKSIEKINVKNCTFFDVYNVDKLPQEELPSFMSMDLSFISIKKVLENCKNLIRDDASAVLLIKPQFEAQRADIEKGGVVKDEKVRKKIIKDIEEFCNSIGFISQGVIESPIQGAKSKNTEYLIYLKRGS